MNIRIRNLRIRLSARDAENTFYLTAVPTENIVLTNAIFQTASEEVFLMNEHEFESERKYQAGISFAKSMLRIGIITENEFLQIDTKLLEKYRPFLSLLLLDNQSAKR